MFRSFGARSAMMRSSLGRAASTSRRSRVGDLGSEVAQKEVDAHGLAHVRRVATALEPDELGAGQLGHPLPSLERNDRISWRPGWGGGKPNALTLSRSPLTNEDMARLVHGLLEQTLPADTRAALIERAGGNCSTPSSTRICSRSAAPSTSFRRPCRGSSQPASTASPSTRRACCKTRRCSARSSGPVPPRQSECGRTKFTAARPRLTSSRPGVASVLRGCHRTLRRKQHA
jgi:hypothetical protein